MISSDTVLTPEHLAREVQWFGDHGEFVYDVETVPSGPGQDDRGVPARNQVTWIGMAAKGHTIRIPMGHPVGTRVTGEVKEPRADKNGKIRNFRVPVYEKPPEQLTRTQVFTALRPLFEDPGIIKAAHGATFDNASVAKYLDGKIPAGKLACTLVMRWLTDENRRRYGLKYITKDVYKFAYDDEEVGRRVEKYPFGMVDYYLHCDVRYTWLEYVRNKRVIREQGLQEVFDLETDLVSVLAEMRTTGVRIDAARLESLRDELTVRVQEQERAVYAAAGRTFNLNAVAQKQAALWKPKQEGGQGLVPWKLTNGGRTRAQEGAVPDYSFYSTDDEALEGFRGNPLVDAILDYQETSKILGTYVIGYLGDPAAKDKPSQVFNGRIYPDFVQYGAGTGRLSCRTPNLQQVPAPRTDLGKMVRGLFIADPGWKLIAADYGQVELVILADLAYKLTGTEGALWKGFHEGIDPHTMTASMVLGKNPGDITKDERQKFGKSLNFSVVYGAGGTKVANMAGMEVTDADYEEGKSRASDFLTRRYEKQQLTAAEVYRRSNDEAEIRAWLLWEKGQKLLSLYNERFPEVRQAKEITLREARKHSIAKTGHPPHAKTILGRMRRLPGLNSTDPGLRAYNERQAFNATIQGSSADITKMAMIRFMKMRRPHWQLLLSVHDELVIAAPENEAGDAASVLVDSMTGTGIRELLSVPLTADPVIVDNWSDAK